VFDGHCLWVAGVFIFTLVGGEGLRWIE